MFEVLRTKGPGAFFSLEPSEPIEIQGAVIEPGTMVCAMVLTHGTELPSEVPRPDGEDSKQFCPRRWLVPPKDNSKSMTVLHPTNRHVRS